MKKISENIKRIRMEKGLTQQEVAEKLFVTRQCVSKWERGKTIPDIKSLERLSELFSCSIHDLLDNDTVKAMVVEEAIAKRRKTKIFWLPLIMSILAISITLYTVIRNQEQRHILDDIMDYDYATIIDIDYDAQKVYFSNSFLSQNVLPVLDYQKNQIDLFNNPNQLQTFTELKKG